MSRSATTSDSFQAIAPPQRRRILTLLAQGEQSVNQLAVSLRVRQPQASKHLKALKAAGLVSVRVVGKQRVHALNAAGLKPVRDWVKSFEQFWQESFDRLDEHLAARPRKGTPNGEHP